MRSPNRVFWSLASVLVLADCSSKRAIESSLPLTGVPSPVIDGVMRFTLAYNQGGAMSTHLGPYQRWILIGVGIVMLCVLARWYRRLAHTGHLAVVGLALIAGGAVGNLLDRVISSRGVVDFIDIGVGANRFYIFNLADVGLSVGAALLAFALWRKDRDASRPELSS
ncbi:MAG: signal peptidase II [bacterium]